MQSRNTCLQNSVLIWSYFVHQSKECFAQGGWVGRVTAVWPQYSQQVIAGHHRTPRGENKVVNECGRLNVVCGLRAVWNSKKQRHYYHYYLSCLELFIYIIHSLLLMCELPSQPYKRERSEGSNSVFKLQFCWYTPCSWVS